MAKIADVIKYEGDNSTFIWKHPMEDFNGLTQLIVHESQEAVFFMNGQALDLFGPGRYTLETQNIPLIGKILNRATDDKTPFHCEVYFINKTEQMAIKWGTDSKVQYIEPTYGFPIYIGASGEMSLKVNDSRKLLVKLVGTENYLNRDTLVSFFRSFLMTRVKTYIAQVMKNNAINIFEIDENITLFSESIKKLLVNDFSDYGMNLERFFVTNIVKPDGDRQYEKFKELHFRQYADIAEAKIKQQTDIIHAQTEAQKTVIESKALATKRSQEGYTYQQERGFDVAEQVAQNEAVGEFTNMGVGFGTMAGVGGAVGGMVGGMMSDAMDSSINASETVQNGQKVNVCSKCGAVLPTSAKFCLNCGQQVIDKSMETIICPNCKKTVAKGKFCPECGFKLENICPKCGAKIGTDAKFCPECGEKL